MDAEESEMFRGILPSILLGLARKGIIDESDLSSAKDLWKKVAENIELATDEWKLGVALEFEFLEAALEQWESDHREIALVLFSTAIEQHLNYCLRFLLDASGLDDQEVTKVIRSTQIEGKLTWLLKLAGQSQLPDSLVARIRSITEIRNSIVHYKALASHPDQGGDSHDLIASKIKTLGDLDIATLFEEFRHQMDTLLRLRHVPYDVALRASSILIENGYLDPDEK